MTVSVFEDLNAFDEEDSWGSVIEFIFCVGLDGEFSEELLVMLLMVFGGLI